MFTVLNPLPSAQRADIVHDSKRAGLYAFSTALIGLGTLVLVGLGAWGLLGQGKAWLADQDRRIPARPLIDVPMRIPTATPTPTFTPTPTRTPIPPTPTFTPTPTPTPLPPLRIAIPKIGLNQNIVEVALKTTSRGGQTQREWVVPAYAVGHANASARPGEPGNIVMNGHNNTLGQVFRRLPELAPGDEIRLYTQDREFTYVVQEQRIVREVGASSAERAEMSWLIAPRPDETLTLVSCWPYVSYTHRIFVIAKPKR